MYILLYKYLRLALFGGLINNSHKAHYKSSLEVQIEEREASVPLRFSYTTLQQPFNFMQTLPPAPNVVNLTLWRYYLLLLQCNSFFIDEIFHLLLINFSNTYRIYFFSVRRE